MAGAASRRFAQAAFELALENGGLERWEDDLGRAANVLRNQDFLALLEAPQVPNDVKLNGVNTLLPDVSPLIRNMVSLMVTRGDVRLFGDVLSEFRSLADERRGIARATVTTAVPLDDARRKRVAEGLARLTGKKQVMVTEQVNRDILGGVVARVGDRLIDGSTRTRLHSLREALAARPVA